MRLFKFFNEKYAIESMLKRKLLVSRLSAFNDPFEMASWVNNGDCISQAVEKTQKEMDQENGVLCMSGGCSNSLMWSHYSDSHRGICLEFEVDDNILYRVSYESKKIAAMSNETLKDDDSIRSYVLKISSTKQIQWEYENEYRLFVKLESPSYCDDGIFRYFVEYSEKLSLEKIIIGSRCPVDIYDVKKLLHDFPGVIIERAIMSNDEFLIRAVEV